MTGHEPESLARWYEALELVLQDSSVLWLQGRFGESAELHAFTWLLAESGQLPSPPERIVSVTLVDISRVVANAYGKWWEEWRGEDFSYLERTYLPAVLEGCSVAFGSPYQPEQAKGTRILDWGQADEDAGPPVSLMMCDGSYQSNIDMWIWFREAQVRCPGFPKRTPEVLFSESSRFWQAIVSGETSVDHLPFAARRG